MVNPDGEWCRAASGIPGEEPTRSFVQRCPEPANDPGLKAVRARR